jgi:hypothetical protein
LVNFVMWLKWWSSIRIFSQIWQYSKYESGKILNTCSCCRQLWWFCMKFKNLFTFGEFFIFKSRGFATKYSFFTNMFCKMVKNIPCWWGWRQFLNGKVEPWLWPWEEEMLDIQYKSDTLLIIHCLQFKKIVKCLNIWWNIL